MSDEESPSLEYQVIVGILLCAIAILTAVGNSLVIISIVLVKSLQTPSNYLIVSLAVSDFLVSLLVFPYSIYRQITNLWGLGKHLCYIYNIFDVLLCTSSILNLCAISIDRYWAITRPLQYAKNRTMKRMLLMILVVWLLSFLISVPPIFIFPPNIDNGQCALSENIFYQMYATFGAFYLPLFVMIILYIRIFKLARKMAIKDQELNKIARRQSTLTDNDQLYTAAKTDQGVVKLSKLNATRPNAKVIPATAPISVRFPLPPSDLGRRRMPRVVRTLDYVTKQLRVKPVTTLNDKCTTSSTTNGAINTFHFVDTTQTIPYVDQSIEGLMLQEERTAPATSILISKLTEQNTFSLPVTPIHEKESNPDRHDASGGQTQFRITQSNSFDNNNSTSNKESAKGDEAQKVTTHLYRQLNQTQISNQLTPDAYKKNQLSVSLEMADTKKDLLTVNTEDNQYFLGRRQSAASSAGSKSKKASVTIDAGSSLQPKLSLNSSHFSINKYGHVNKKANYHKTSSESKAIKTLGIIMGCFSLCWIPFFIIAISKPIYMVIYDKNLEISMHIETLFLWLGYVNSTLNPVIYALFNLEFRVPFQQLLTCRCRNLNARLRSERYANEFGSLVF